MNNENQPPSLPAVPASHGKEQGESGVTHARPISKEKTPCHTDETKQRDEQRDANTQEKSESAPAERCAEGTATETTSRDARPGSSGSAGAFCPERLTDNATGASSPKSSSSSATVRGPMEGLIKLNEQQQLAIKEWAADSPLGDLWGNDEAREINLATFARTILKHATLSGIEGQPAQEVSKEMWTAVKQDNPIWWDILDSQGNAIVNIPWEEAKDALLDAHNASIQRLVPPPLPDNGEQKQEFGDTGGQP